ncbi:MAG: succinate dehydrogenase, hydrophobic membrane anchor protein [Rhodospirillales bacterium]|jgi:succinate dehydrogenase / fumarate reductase membrane anchor subunit
MSMRTPLNRARGSGSTKDGTGHWWAQRLTGVALVPLTLWFVFSVISLAGADYAAFKAWAGDYGRAVLLILLIIAIFHHAQLGLQVVIEDYVHKEATKVVMMVVMKFAVYLCAAGCLVAVLKFALGS